MKIRFSVAEDAIFAIKHNIHSKFKKRGLFGKKTRPEIHEEIKGLNRSELYSCQSVTIIIEQLLLLTNLTEQIHWIGLSKVIVKNV